jgi:hypothetical protein
MSLNITATALSLGLFVTLGACELHANFPVNRGRTSPSTPPSGGARSDPAEEGDFLLGVENVPHQRMEIVSKVLPVFRDAGYGLVGRNSLRWSLIEPTAPRGGVHRYVFDSLDQEFRAYAEAGVQLQVTFLCRSPWGTEVRDSNLSMDIAGSPPLDDHWDDFGLAVAALVERYDGDGEDDAFPLDRPLIRVLNIQEEVEFRGHWAAHGGTPENYGRLLSVAYEHAKGADPSLLVGRSGTSVGTYFDLDPRPDWEGAGAGMVREALEFLRYSLAHPVPYDLFSLHVNRSYTGLVPMASYVRAEMKKAGYERELMIDDAATINCVKRTEPYQSAESIRVLDIETGDRLVLHQTAHTIKIAALARAAGIRCLLFTGLMDIPSSPFKQIKYGGFIDSVRFKRTRSATAALRPVFYSLAHLHEILRESETVEIVKGMPRGVWVVRFEADGKISHVAWSEREGIEASIAVATSEVTIRALTRIDGNGEPESMRVKAKGGKLTLSLGPSPVLVD